MLPDGTATSQEVIISQPVGTATYYCTVTDGGRLTATDSLEVTVLTSSGTTSTSLLKQWVRVRTFDMNGVLTGYAWVPGVTQSAQPTTAP
jgi:hypothetical protein